MFKNLRIIICFFVFGFYTNVFCQKGPVYPVDSSYTVQGQYKKYLKKNPYITIAHELENSDLVENRDIVYATLKNTPYGKRDLHLDVFRPSKEGTYPVLILVHGGGWRAGNKSLLIPMAQRVAQKGFVAITVEYQLALEAQYPAAIYNVKAAIRWVRANADKYGMDPDYIAIGGTSAGGHIASLVGLTNGVEKFEGDMGNKEFSSDVQAVLDIDGAINLMEPLSLNKERSHDSPDVQWLGGTFAEKPLIWKDASPIYWANENTVPMLFLNSGYPRFHVGQDELIGMLDNWGIYHEEYKFQVEMHTFWLFHPWIDVAVEYMTDFMHKTHK